jgi:hypothetical protein
MRVSGISVLIIHFGIHSRQQNAEPARRRTSATRANTWQSGSRLVVLPRSGRALCPAVPQSHLRQVRESGAPVPGDALPVDLSSIAA